MPRNDRDRDDRDDYDDRPRPKAGGSNAVVIVAVVLVAVVGVLGLGALACAGLFGGVLFSTSAKVKAASDRAKSQNNLKQMGLAMHNQHDVDGVLQGPFAAGPDGPATGHSFRVGLLPYLEQTVVYRQIDLTQPWDSAKNAPATGTVVPEYLDPTHPASVGTATPYRTFVGPGAIFEGKAKMPKLQDITDGTSNTIVYVAATQTVPWASPQELAYGPGIALPPLGSPQANGFHAVFADGSVRYLLRTIAEADLRSLIEKADGRVVNIP